MKQILEIFNRSELQKFKQFLQFNTDAKTNKRIELFNLIISKKHLTDEEASKKLYGERNSSKYYHLKKRLGDDILKIVLIQNNNKLYKETLPQKKIECRKLIIAGEWIVNKGSKEAGKKLLIKALKIAETYHFYNEIITIKDLLRLLDGIQNKLTIFSKESRGIHQHLRNLSSALQAKEAAYKIGLINNFKTNTALDQNEEIQKILQELKNIKENTPSPIVHYWYHQAYANYHYSLKNFEETSKHYDALIDILQNHPSTYGRQRHANFLLAKIKLFLCAEKYDEMDTYFQKLKPFLFPKSHNEYKFLERSLLFNLRKKNYDICSELIEQLYAHKRTKNTNFHKNKIILYEAFLFFQKGDRDNALHILSTVTELNKDKSGWLLGIGYLELLILFELKEFSVLSYRLDNLSHLLFRQKKQKVARIKIILKILKTLLRRRGDFQKTNEQHKQQFQILQTNKDQYYWDPLGFEIIRFERWFKNKII